MSEHTGRTRIALAALVVAAAVGLAGCDWVQLGFGPERTFFNPAEPNLTVSSAPHLTGRWSTACTCRGTLLVAGETVYALDRSFGDPPSTSLRAFDVADGRARWSTPVGPGGSNGTLAAVANGLVYLTVDPAEGSDSLVAIDAVTGRPAWRVTPPAPGSGPVRLDDPIVDGPLVFVAATASDASVVTALDTAGRRVWRAAPGGIVFVGGASLAAVPGQTLYVASVIGLSVGAPVNLLRGYAVSDGTLRSSVLVPNDLLVESIAAANGLVYGTWYTSFGRFGYLGGFAIQPETGALAWSGDMFTLAITPGSVLTSDARAGTLTARHPTTGAVLWTVNQTGTASATDQLVFSSVGDIRRLTDGALVGGVRGADGDPILGTTPANGRVFAVSPTTLYAFAP